ncbi:MAG: prepilin-type N-terminal cleavage/methylation domain-containing protein [Verrucomicrobia bacterium]|nr:prepilin-type N-terminal cleavage/methylation domain-containing protein [Verrucomicrobiota bacterium]
MRKIIRGFKKLKANSFTLVELLVVISIIGLLAGLAVPAIQGGLDKAKQGVDVSNARQLGIIFFSEANDNNGMYRVNGDLTNTQAAGSFLTIVQGMFSNGVLTSAKILSGQGVIPATSPTSLSQSNVTLQDSYPWKKKGIVVYRVGNSAEFLKAGANGAPVGSANIGMTNSNSVLQP